MRKRVALVPSSDVAPSRPACPNPSTFGTQIVEVEVDEETGEVTLTRIVAAHDVGCAINPQNVEGQIQVAQPGNWSYLDGRSQILPRGRAPHRWLPGLQDSVKSRPPSHRTAHRRGTDEEGPFGARGIGEPLILARPCYRERHL